MPKVPVYPPPKVSEPPHRRNPKSVKREVSTRETEVVAELQHLDAEFKRLKSHRNELVFELKRLRTNSKYGTVPVKLYALRLEGDYWYVGMTYNVDKRFKKHCKGKGAQWTKAHKPIEIVEERVTEFLLQEQVAPLEDDMTIEYALRYGADKVRGGGFCQFHPHWPAVVLENELGY